MTADQNHVRRSLADAHRAHARANAKRATSMTAHARRERFCQLFIETFDAKRAAVAVGYEAEYGNRLLRARPVQDRIHGLLKKAARLINKESIVTRLWREAMREDEGSTHAARVQALGKLAEVYGLTRHAQEHHHRIEWVQTLELHEIDTLIGLSDAELAVALEQRQLPAPRDLLDDAPPVLPSVVEETDA